jgi:CO/xanthine dehydrogenase FAD-binding subunit
MSLNLINTRILSDPFEYFEPSSLEEAIDILDKHKEHAAVLAGGTDLLVRMKQKRINPKCLINIKRIAELKTIKQDESLLRIGATITMLEIQRSRLVEEKLPILHEAIASVGSVQIRNMGTLGGNLCRASPSGDSLPPLLILDAKVNLRDSTGARVVPLDEFFKGPGKTSIKPSEILTEIHVSIPPTGTGMSFMKIKRAGMDLAKVNAAASLTIKNNIVQSCGVAIGSVAPTPIRVKKAEATLIGNKATDEKIDEAALKASEEVRPYAESHRHRRSTAQYRIDVSRVLVRRTLMLARERSSGRR